MTPTNADDAEVAVFVPRGEASKTSLGYGRYCGGLVVTGDRGEIATCQGCGLFGSVQWWRGELVRLLDRTRAAGAQDRARTVLGERVARLATPEARANIRAQVRRERHVRCPGCSLASTGAAIASHLRSNPTHRHPTAPAKAVA